MKNKKLSVLIAVPALMLAFSVQAHSEKEHMKNAESPECGDMSTMDPGKMDMSDPVMMAMMQQCMSTMQHGSAEPDAASSHGSAESDDASSHGHGDEVKPGHHKPAE
ncbi:hypothetical protein [Neptunomonas antarctica]|uniref:Pentapeptide MXKDX repeat protein n=1 Tax=Neptunomonas antarctica TaxID=619304 RepID=A0A1N7KW75_9GAMM|nr:hypothetical protein [Neptunomonas antarctica]SIS65791.1 hypothetical protein SAMN05421760_10321 [Neptunomonas antarctica]